MEWQLGLNFYTERAVLFSPADLEKEEIKREIENNKYHIYLICKRKKIYFKEFFAKGNTGYTIMYYLDDTHEKKYLHYESAEITHTEYKDGFYYMKYKGEDIVLRDFLWINNATYFGKDLVGDSIVGALPSDLEVMYIGQAFGRTATKKIDYRVANHDKIQKIAIDITNKGTNEEVLIIGICVGVSDLATSIVTIDSKTERPKVEDLLKLRDKARQRIPEAQEITVFEASLIKYFQPALNIEYKQTFPAPDYSSYEDIYKTEFNYSGMTLDTNPICARTYSQHLVQRKYIHHQHYPLKTKSDKKSLFEYLLELSEAKGE